MKLTLTRDPQQSYPYCTLGVLEAPSLTLQTMELPWYPASAAPCGLIGHSCIGKGTYALAPRYTEARGHHFILSNPELGIYRYPSEVPDHLYGRSLVLIHVANWAHELLGCIAPGRGRGFLEGEYAVTDSAHALVDLVRTYTSGAELEIQ